MINITKIYLVENCYGDPNKVYIGKTKNSRETNHKITFGKQITYSIIDEVNSLNKEDYIPLERFWINYFKLLGFTVLNKNEGGAGVEYCKEETKLKMSKTRKGRTMSSEWKLNMSKARMGRPNPFSKSHLQNFLKSKSKPVIQKNMNGDIIKEFNSISEAARYICDFYKNKYPLYNIMGGISMCCNGKTKTGYKFKWEFVN